MSDYTHRIISISRNRLRKLMSTNGKNPKPPRSSIRISSRRPTPSVLRSLPNTRYTTQIATADVRTNSATELKEVCAERTSFIVKPNSFFVKNVSYV